MTAWLAIVVLASCFVALLRAAGMPAAFLLGPMIAAIVVAVCGGRARLPRIFIIAGAPALAKWMARRHQRRRNDPVH